MKLISLIQSALQSFRAEFNSQQIFINSLPIVQILSSKNLFLLKKFATFNHLTGGTMLKKTHIMSLCLFLVLSLTFHMNAQWVEQTSGTTVALYSISAVDNNVCWIGGATGIVLRTTNGGTNWTNVGGAGVGSADVYTIFAIDANNALCSTSPAATFVYRTTDGGTSWTQVFTQTGGFLNSIWMTSATDGFMYGDPVGARWTLFRTTTGGVTWDSTGLFLPQAGAEAGWNNAMYVNGSNIYFGTNNTRIYYSSNNGSSWTPQITTGQVNSYSMWFNSTNVGLAGGTQLVATTNAGTNWAALTSTGTGNISGIIGYQNQWYFTRQATSIYSSTNNGVNWTTAFTAPAGSYYHIAKARNGDVAWACRSNGGITKGTNVGLPVELTSFTAQLNSGRVTLNWSTASELNNLGFEVQRKTVTGEIISDWAVVAFREGRGTTSETQNYEFVDDVRELSADVIAYRLKQIDYDGTFEYSSEVQVENSVPLAYGLDKNYPNPFNPNTVIKYQLAADNFVSLKVFNALGQEVSTLVNEVMSAGSHEVNFSAENLTSGVYYYVLRVSLLNGSEKVFTNKMMLLK